jgi:hypothetical protein
MRRREFIAGVGGMTCQSKRTEDGCLDVGNSAEHHSPFILSTKRQGSNLMFGSQVIWAFSDAPMTLPASFAT